MRNLIRIVSTAVLVAIGTLAFSQSALAVKWHSKSDPLYGYEDGDRFGAIYGDFFNHGSVQAKSSTWMRDLQPGGNDVRGETDFYYKEFDAHCGEVGTCWNFAASKQTNKWRKSTWFYDYRTDNLHPQADAVRGGINLCEVQSWHPDPCSAHAYPSFSY